MTTTRPLVFMSDSRLWVLPDHLHGQCDPEGRTPPRLARRRELAAVSEHDLLRDGEPEPRPLGLRGHEELEDIDALGKPRSVVPDRDQGPAVRGSALEDHHAAIGHGFD